MTTLLTRGGGSLRSSSHEHPAQAPNLGGSKLRCTKCGRECRPWPLERGRRCSPKTWAMCIRSAEDCELI